MSKYGNLNDIPATGASPETGRQDGENISGVIASEKLAKADLQRVNSYKEKIMSVSRKTGMDPAIIAAMMSRESRAGKALDANHEGDHGNAFGLMQIDKRRHTPRGAWNSEEHILQATEILISMFETIKKKFPSWSRSYVMKGNHPHDQMCAAYNTGPDNVKSFDAVDRNTTRKDYSNDFIARAKFYKRNGY
ncbi:lysozyme g-like isoform X2 [Aquarana catesbeiana]|uniref:lysozyme g-like isoform X2 n=1 Tax=Aquarana catesbeiana TaxID=8400 RepID=UPI003CCA15A0